MAAAQPPRPPRRGPAPAVWVLLVLGVLMAAWLAWRPPAGLDSLARWATLDGLKAGRDQLLAWRDHQPLAMAAAYFVVYVLSSALSFPGATVLTLAGGAVFGFWGGLVLVSFASSLGALLAFASARWLLRDAVQRRFGARLAAVNAGLARDGGLYLLSLRLAPVLPFFVINLLAGLTALGAARFYAISQLGMLPATAAYVNAGTQLATLQRPGDVLSVPVLASLLALAVLPLAAKAALAWWQQRHRRARWPRPRRFDRNLIVIGAGAGGLVTAYIAAAVKARVTLVEAQAMGGDCLNHGCVPSKALIHAARAAARFRAEARARGLAGAALAPPDFAAVMTGVQQRIAAVAPHDSVERYTALGVDVQTGQARLTSPWTVAITRPDGSTHSLSSRAIVLATGSRPIVPDIPGLAELGCLTSDTVWGLRQLPARLLVLGGGPIGCELAQALAQLGSEVTLVEAAPRLLGREDADAAALVAEALVHDGVRLLTGHRALRAERGPDGQRRLVVQAAGVDGGAGPETTLPFDELLCAVGRRAHTEGLGLDALGIVPEAAGTLAADGTLRTSWPHILAVGDVAGPWQFTHTASHQAWTAAVNALFGGPLQRWTVDGRVIPRCTFTAPELAQVGLTVAEAQAQGVDAHITRYEFCELDRTLIDGGSGGRSDGFVQVLTVPGRDRILGVTIVGEQAGELVAQWALAMRHGLGLNAVLATVHAYPTRAESAKAVAGRWKQAHAPQRLLALAAAWFRWRRG